ncbi:MAG TPA: TerC/Alx family metal homeostasis membrane protein [Gaiellales bacterium]|jgi:tellurite resistance protein TerC|nr:TerC/Alx family metal homeostasis membrane protein [Gaiellales bacterium]
MRVEAWEWAALAGLTATLIAVDMRWSVRDERLRPAAAWSCAWFLAGVAFAGAVWTLHGGDAAGRYLAGYLIERSLSIDNVFVFVAVFGYFAVPAGLRRPLLTWGVASALVMRGAFILGGIAVLAAFHWAIYVFGAVLIATGVRMAAHRGRPSVDLEHSRLLATLRRLVPVATEYRGRRLVAREDGRAVATPLLVALVAVVVADVVFAIDSIPSILAITTEPILVVAANALALVGLRSLYHLVAGMTRRFAYLDLGLAAILVLVGVKMAASELYEPPVWAALAAILALIATTIVLSVVRSGPATRRTRIGTPRRSTT